MLIWTRCKDNTIEDILIYALLLQDSCVDEWNETEVHEDRWFEHLLR